VYKAYKVAKEHKQPVDRQVVKAYKAAKEHKVNKVVKVFRAHKLLKELKVDQDNKAFKAPSPRQVLQEILEHKDVKVHKASKELKVWAVKVFKVQQEPAEAVAAALKAPQAIKVLRALKEHPVEVGVVQV
jgi:hypothetical protein